MCDIQGPGYSSPMEAFRSGKKEKILYVICICPESTVRKQPDYLATVDVDPESATYCQVIHRTSMNHIGDELHHFGWNTCSSCYDKKHMKRDKLVLPCLNSDRIYILDVAKPTEPKLIKEISGKDVRKLDVSALHTSHCLPDGDIMISAMGDAQGNGKGDFVLIDGKTLSVKGLWNRGEGGKFGYDFWYQPYLDVLIASEWGAPRSFKCGFSVEATKDRDLYGQNLNIYSWSQRKLIQTIDLGPDGVAPLEIRFLHDPKAEEGYVGCALKSKVYRFFKKEDNTWAAEPVIHVMPKKVSGWVTPEIFGLISDIVISMDDKFLYFSNWLHGDVRQYDITDTKNPKLVGRIFLGGKLLKDSPLELLEEFDFPERPDPVFVKGRRLYGSPQMLQLSLDGKRLYVTTSLYSPWDRQIYPEMVEHGSVLVKLDVNTAQGGLTLDPNFLVDFGKEPGGPVLAHETRYPGGDCTSDIYLADCCS